MLFFISLQKEKARSIIDEVASKEELRGTTHVQKEKSKGAVVAQKEQKKMELKQKKEELHKKAVAQAKAVQKQKLREQ